jgi:SAM-dependent methyltransferase
MSKSRDAWQRLYSKHGLQYGGSGDIGPLDKSLREGMLVLDAGCGDGKTTELLSRRCEVVACDFSREALLSLRLQRDPDGVVNLVECNIGSLPFEQEKFDAVSCVHSLSHLTVADRRKAAAEMSRVLRHGGFLLVEVFGRADLRFGEGAEIEDSTFERGNGIVTHYFQEGEIPALFGGMELISEVSALRRVTFGTVAGRREVQKVVLRKK